MALNLRRPVVGILLIAPPRFHDLGAGTESGMYWERKEREAKNIVARFSFAEKVYPGVVYTREQVERAVQMFRLKKADCIFAHFLSWSDDFAWIRFLRDIGEDMPILFASISREQPGFEDSLEEERFIEFLSAGGLVGALEASGTIARFARPLLFTALGRIQVVMEQAESFSKAACLRTELRQTVFALLPTYNEAMWATYVDPYDIFMKVGPELHFLTVAELEDEITQIRREKTEDVMEKILRRYPSDKQIRRDKFFASVESSLAVESLARKHHAELVVLNDINPALMNHIGLRPGFSPCTDADDVMVTPEGDLGGGLACYLLRKLSGRHVSFVEPFYIDERDGTFAAGHAGPNDYTDPDGKIIISTDTRFAKSQYKHAGAPFAWNVIGAGEKTMVHVSQCNGRFKMVCSLVDALETGHFLAGYSHGRFRPRIPVEEFFRKLLEIGVTQHYGVAGGDFRRELRIIAKLLDFDYSEI